MIGLEEIGSEVSAFAVELDSPFAVAPLSAAGWGASAVDRRCELQALMLALRIKAAKRSCSDDRSNRAGIEVSCELSAEYGKC